MMPSAIWVPTRYIGLSDDIGSWKIIEMRSPRTSSICLSLNLSMRVPASSTRLSGETVAVRGKSFMMARAVTDLPEPELADQRQHLAAVDMEGDVAHRLDFGVVELEAHGEVADFDEVWIDRCVHVVPHDW